MTGNKYGIVYTIFLIASHVADTYVNIFPCFAVKKGLFQKTIILLIQMPILFSFSMHNSGRLLMLNGGQGRPLAHKWFYTFSDSP